MTTNDPKIEAQAREMLAQHRHALAMMLAEIPHYEGDDPRALYYGRNRAALEAALEALSLPSVEIRREARDPIIEDLRRKIADGELESQQ